MRIVLLAFLITCASAGVARAQDNAYITTTDGVRLAYRTVGDGTAVVAIHGGPGLGMSSLFADLAPLAAAHRVTFYDQRGAGQSQAGDTAQASMDRHLRDLDELIARLGAGKVVLVGHSWGAGVAALYAAAHPDRVAGMVLLAPMIVRVDPWGQVTAARSRERADTALDRRIAEHSRAMMAGSDPAAECRARAVLILQRMVAPGGGTSRADLCDIAPPNVRLGPAVIRATMRGVGNWDWREAAAAYRGPVLVIHGEGDATPLEASREWSGLYTRGELRVIRGAGHMPHVSAPDEVFAAIRTFVAGTTAR